MNRCPLLLLLALFAPLEAQDTGGSISGRVVDSTGAAVPRVEVVATHVETGALRKTTSSAEGEYAFPNLPIGPYQLSASHPGFKKLTRTGIELHVSEHLGVDLTIEVGELAQEVLVTAAAEQIQTESSEEGSLISGEQVRELQLNGRSMMTLLELIPGVSSNMPDRADPNTGPDLSINGARSSASNFNIDGGNNADVIVGSSSLNTFTSVETVAEFTVLTSTFSAEYGRAGFSQVNVVTKSGTKRFHGSVYEFFRNDALDATDYFSHQVLPLKLNNFGYTIGGPMLLPGYNRDRKKTFFFFFAQEFNRISMRQEAVNTTVPTAAERSGDFSASPALTDPRGGGKIPGNQIPRDLMDANALKLLTLFPLPNFRGPGAINYTSAAPSKQNWHEEMIRLDHNFSPQLKVYARYVQDGAFVRNPYGGSGTTGASTKFPGIAETQSDRPGRNLVVNLSNVVRPTLLNQFNFTWARRFFDMHSASPLADRKALGLNIPELFPENDGNVVPSISMTSYAGLSVPRRGHKELFTLEFSDNLTKIAGRHIVKTGAIYAYGGNLEQPFSPNTTGSFSFTTAFTGNAVANFLLGLPLTYSEVEKTVWSDARFGMLEAFVQDDFKARPNLTLNIGVRYSAYLHPYDRYNVLSNFLPARWNPAKAPAINPSNGQLLGGGDSLNGVVIAGNDSPWGRRVTNNNANLIGPRFGFAWSPLEARKLAIRGGYGIAYTRPLIGTFINNAFDNPPFQHSVTLQRPAMSDLGAGVEQPAVNPVNLTALPNPLLAPMVQQWSFDVQQEVAKNAIVKVSYVGSHVVHLQRPLAINNAEPGAAAAAKVNVNYVRPYRGWGSITERESSGSSLYHSLQVSVNRRMARSFSAGLAYTFAKSIDDGSSERGSGDLPPDSHNTRAERAPSDFDRTHVLTSSFIWNVPRLARGRALGAFVNGWQWNGIVRMWSGRPLDVTLSTDVAGIGATQNQRPNVIADTRGGRTVEEWFNRTAFARPATGTFGNMGRNGIRGSGVNKWDLSLFKNFAVGERCRVQFRAEMFNAFNHPSFTTVGTALNTTASGVNPNVNNFAVVTGTRDARVIQFALKVLF